ncbi:putative lipid II flippase FtsW [uncultured Oscillibacter sp.]|uniref:putative lipid II flippase FtsW n=1 Tax=uncultured Oscillibacter sp. TaxID=876091 RepID=UPI0025D90A67|nr:putative lipid II flippase FtsW [uncultured Oscillibacter sp.]
MVETRRRRRPISREEALARQEKKRRRKEREELSRELARGPIDLPFCLLVLMLMGVGLVMLLSASFPSAYYDNDDPIKYFRQQGVFAIAGVAAMLFIGKINYQRFRGAAKPLLYLSIVLLVLVIIPGNPIALTRNHATRWLGIRNTSFQFQPSEVAKMAVVLYFSDTISKKKDKMNTTRYGVAPYLLILGVLSLLMMLEPHLSGTVLILSAGAVLMLVGGINLTWVAAAVAGAGGIAFLMFSGVIKYGQSRLAMWQNPWLDPRGDGYQLVQSLLSIGSGGLWGVGLGRSMQKFLYLPEEHNDFIFAIVCEELGLIGATIIMLLFAALILRGYWIALHARDRFGSLLVVGVTTLIAMQTFLNIGVVTGLLPTTGISLPFFSYGGTALMIQLAEMGIVLSVSRQMKPTKAG